LPRDDAARAAEDGRTHAATHAGVLCCTQRDAARTHAVLACSAGSAQLQQRRGHDAALQAARCTADTAVCAARHGAARGRALRRPRGRARVSPGGVQQQQP
jgi:hypothetical protein